MSATHRTPRPAAAPTAAEASQSPICSTNSSSKEFANSSTPNSISHASSRFVSQTSLPLPKSVHLFNLFLPKKKSHHQNVNKRDGSGEGCDDGEGGENESYYKFRPEHSVSLLERVRLEMVVRGGEQDACNSTMKKQSDLEGNHSAMNYNYNGNHVLHTAVHSTSVHPSWKHLNERINIEGLTLEMYESMTFHFSCRCPRRSDSRSNGERRELHENRIAAYDVFSKVPVHPKKLVQISDSNTLPPLNLPVNAVMIHFTDDSIRVVPELYRQLEAQLKNDSEEQQPCGTDDKQRGRQREHDLNNSGVTATSPLPPNDFSRFEDDVFETLDQVTITNEQKQESNGSSSPIPLIFQDDICKTPDQKTLLPCLDDDENLSTLEPRKAKATTTNTASYCATSSLLSTSVEEVASPTTAASCQKETNFAGTVASQKANLQDLLQEREFLENSRIEEEAMLESLKSQLIKRATTTSNGSDSEPLLLQDLMQQIHVVEQQTNQVRTATAVEASECLKAEYLLKAQRIKLVKELEMIYPIELSKSESTSSDLLPIVYSLNDNRVLGITSDHSYRICGLELPPMKLLSATNLVSDDEVSAALGITCHVVIMLSKYLGVQLRYRLYYHSSRSAVADENFKIYPLFQAGSRMVEREQLEYGVTLLHRNVECIAISAGILLQQEAIGELPIRSNSTQQLERKLQLQQQHILAKVQCIYHGIIQRQKEYKQ